MATLKVFVRSGFLKDHATQLILKVSNTLGRFGLP